MPYKKIKNADGTYRVVNSDTGKVHAKATTLKNADAQVRLLYMKENEKEDLGWDTPKNQADATLIKRGYK